VKTSRPILVALLLWSGQVGVMAQGAPHLAAQLVGTWRLVATRQLLSDGTVRPEVGLGPRGVGYIMYSDTGRMCAFLSNPDRPRWKSQTEPNDTELRAAFEGVVAYCGTYEVNEPERYVVHHVEMDKVPNLAGTDRKRYVTLSGNRLLLRPSALPEGIKEWTIEWERVPNK
jgi:hypothetical protein